MVEIFLIKNDPDGNPLFRFEVRNFKTTSIDLLWPVTPAPLPEEDSSQNVLVKLTGNVLQSNVSWTLKNYDVNQETLAGAATKTVQEQINFFINAFQPTSIEDSFQLVYNYPDSPIVFSGFMPSVKFHTTPGTPVTWIARATFLQGTVIAIYELDTPTTPLNVAVSSPIAGTIDVEWDDPADSGTNALTGFRVQHQILGGPFIDTDLGLVNSTSINFLVPGTYNVRVIGRSDLGLGRPSVLKEVIVA